ncbi:MAG TPA: hypothetical protein VFJ16_29360 [Longimicrobium sp.]|nr:hypothetical protein [Longimicrobium sp.]
MSDDTPAGGDPRNVGETPAEGPPPPPYPPPPPPGGGGYGGQGGGGGYGARQEYQEWPHEAPPGTGYGPGPRQKDPGAVGRGVRAAAMIFGAAVLLHLLTLAAVAISGNGNNAGFFIPEGLLVVFVGFIVAIVVSIKLPIDSRAPFWISGVAFMALSFIIWGATCAIGLSVSPVSFH